MKHVEPKQRTPAWPSVATGLALSVWLIGATPAPPDLRLEWQIGGQYTRVAPPLVGAAGSTVTLVYRLRNVGGSDAFAAILSTFTALGPQGRVVRLRPGPGAGLAFERTLDLPLAAGMREVCIETRLQTLGDNEPRDPNPGDNTVCRRVSVREAPGSAHGGTGFHARQGD